MKNDLPSWLLGLRKNSPTAGGLSAGLKVLPIVLALVCRWWGFASLLLIGMTAARAVDEPVNEAVNFAYATPDGVVWVDAYRGVVAARAGEDARVVFSEAASDLAAVSGPRLVMAWKDKLFTFPAGSWTPRRTETGRDITALAASPETALAFDEEAGLWSLAGDDTWSRRDSGIKDEVLGAAWDRGLWVAVGSTHGIDLEEEEQELGYGGREQPFWEAEQRSPRLWWSADGVTWQPGSLTESGYNMITVVAGLQGRWLAASVSGALYGSADGKSWERVGQLENDDPWAKIRLVAMGGEFLICHGNEGWWRSTTGRDWQPVPVAAGARLDAPFMKDDQVYAVGLRRSDRRVEIAALADFAETPGPSAAELAASTAAEKAARMAVDKRHEAWAQKLARWDVAMTQARDTDTRLQLCKTLHADWQALHPGYTQAKAVAYLNAVYARMTGYEISDHVLYNFVTESMSLSPTVAAVFVSQLPTGTGASFKKISADQIAISQAQQRRQKPPAVPPRIQTKKVSPVPSRFFAPFDVDAVRQLAARGKGAACYDLSLLYLHGQGVPVDQAASRFWAAQAAQAGIEFSKPAGDDKDAQMENWRKLAEQGSRGARLNYAVMLRDWKGDATAALEQLKLAAAAGHRYAMLDAYQAYLLGQGTEIDIAAGRKFLTEAADQNFPLALAAMGWSYEAGAGVPRDLAKAAALYRRAAELGNERAMSRYADFLFAGHGGPVDQAAGLSWMRKAAARGDETAKQALAGIAAEHRYRARPLEIYTPPKQLRPIFDMEKRRQRAEGGEAAACYDLAYAYWNGLGVRQDDREGNRWMERAKAAGWQTLDKWKPEAEAMKSWAAYADQGSIVAMDKVANNKTLKDTERLALIRRAAEAGMAPSQFLLASFYRDGIGVAADSSESFKWFKRAAETGDVSAQRTVGFAYESGARGVARDYTLSAHWYKLAADGKDEIAMANLANLQTLGRGTPADPTAAASLYLQLAGLPADAVSPEEAAIRIRSRAEAGDVRAFAAWGVVLRRGFGVQADIQASFAYGFVASALDENPFGLRWFETKGLQWASALRLAAGIAAKEYVYTQQELAQDPAVAANIASGKFPSFDDLLASASPNKSTVLHVLRALQDDLWTDDLVNVLQDAREPFMIEGLAALVAASNKRIELVGQPWMLRLAGVTKKPADANDAEKLFQAALLTPAANAAGNDRLRALRRLQAARLYYGIDCTIDRPAALTWILLSMNENDVESLYAVELLSRELTPAQVDAADEIYQRISSSL